MHRESIFIPITVALLLLVLALPIGYYAIEGIINDNVLLLSKFNPGKYASGSQGVMVASAYLMFSLTLIIFTIGVFDIENWKRYLFVGKFIAILAVVVLLGSGFV